MRAGKQRRTERRAFALRTSLNRYQYIRGNNRKLTAGRISHRLDTGCEMVHLHGDIPNPQKKKHSIFRK